MEWAVNGPRVPIPQSSMRWVSAAFYLPWSLVYTQGQAGLQWWTWNGFRPQIILITLNPIMRECITFEYLLMHQMIWEREALCSKELTLPKERVNFALSSGKVRPWNVLPLKSIFLYLGLFLTMGLIAGGSGAGLWAIGTSSASKGIGN